MEFVKIYKNHTDNFKKTLAQKVGIDPLLAKAANNEVKSFLSKIRDHGSLNFGEVGARAAAYLSANDFVKIICSATCYSGRVISKMHDPNGELGDLLGWSRMHKHPFQHPFALEILSIESLAAHEINALVSGAPERADNFFEIASPARKHEALVEGNIVELTLTSYERDPAARNACLEHFSARCMVCKMDFGERYGELGKGFIHIHHIMPLSQIREVHVVDPIRDLVPVCPNCHAMLHIRKGKPLSINELQQILAMQNK